MAKEGSMAVFALCHSLAVATKKKNEEIMKERGMGVFIKGRKIL